MIVSVGAFTPEITEAAFSDPVLSSPCPLRSRVFVPVTLMVLPVVTSARSVSVAPLAALFHALTASESTLYSVVVPPLVTLATDASSVTTISNSTPSSVTFSHSVEVNALFAVTTHSPVSSDAENSASLLT